MRFSWLALAAIPVAVSGAELTARAALNMVPGVPDSAQAAMAQWQLVDGNLKPTGQLKAFEDAIQSRMMAQSQAAMQQQAAGAGSQMEMAQRMQAQYGSPEAQAKLKSMSPGELMAMAQAMQPAMPQAGPVSEHDAALVSKVNMYPGIGDIEQQIQTIRNEQIALEQQWQTERQALNDKMRQDAEKLPVCPGEAGEPPSDKVRDLDLKYADQRIALASKYLAKYKVLEQRMRTTVTPRVDYGDQAMAAWSQIQGSGIKQMTAAQAQAAQNMGITDASNVAGVVQNASQAAAQEIVERKRIVDMYKDIRPGCG